ncbi:MAG: peptidylprolyl isomerase [Bacteroidales bacterium]|nr:peptidylprolyl isomerase [Bacteroidales bacterium]MDZ4205162.1 peptidylprolyl isomerase [Bacteroidales bacterium]
MSQPQAKKEKETLVLIQTDMGDITLKLYNETPLHRNNFVKLVKDGYYNGSIFHRIIKEFMIQGGGGATGSQDPGYTIPAEFIQKHYHKKGALAAARMGDQVNPKKESSGSQFYIVHGRIFPAEQLTALGQRSGKTFTEEQIEVYSTIGGSPHLDGDYTVFGEVVSGLDVIDRIAAVPTGQADRPVTEIKMKMKILE